MCREGLVEVTTDTLPRCGKEVQAVFGGSERDGNTVHNEVEHPLVKTTNSSSLSDTVQAVKVSPSVKC